MEITDEIRNAVHREDCERLGHDINLMNALTVRVEVNSGGMDIGSNDDLRIPHLKCDRCSKVWMVIPMEGGDYEDGERLLYSLLNPQTKIAKLITRIRGQREERNKNGKAQSDTPQEEAAEEVAPPSDSADTSSESDRPRRTTGSVGQAS